jgi:hypothetical protein
MILSIPYGPRAGRKKSKTAQRAGPSPQGHESAGWLGFRPVKRLTRKEEAIAS